MKFLLIPRWLLLLFLFYLLVQFGRFFKSESEKILSEPIGSWEQDLSGDCGLVLTGGPGRLKEGFDMLVRGQVQRLIVSGVHPQATIHELFPQMILFPRIQEKNIVLEKRSETTFGNAQQSLPLVEALNCKTVLLVTSYLHMYRALQTFRSSFPKEITLMPYAVSGSLLPPTKVEVLTETLKSLFYSVWAY